MSPIPSPTPLRRKLSRVLFSPAGLLCGFVVLLIATCPGARGEVPPSLIAGGPAAFNAGAVPLSSYDMVVPLTKPVSDRPIGRSTRFDRVKPAADARSATPSERSSRTTDAMRHSRAALPLLIDPMFTAAPGDPVVRIRPMTGTPVGTRPEMPASRN